MLHRSVHYTAWDDMTSIKFTALPHGPYRLEGQVTIFDRGGQPIPDRAPPSSCAAAAARPTSRSLMARNARTAWKEDA